MIAHIAAIVIGNATACEASYCCPASQLASAFLECGLGSFCRVFADRPAWSATFGEAYSSRSRSLFEEGFTILDLTPSSPVPTFPSIDPEDLGIVVRDRVYRFPAGDEGRKLQSNYAWMHQTVQPIGILATFISASMTALHATQAGYIGLRRRQAAKELVEPFCQAVAGVSDAMDKLAPGSSQTPER
jgi:hypothetical protein